MPIPIRDRHTGELLFTFPGDNFVGQDLRSYKLISTDLSGHDLSYANMQGMNLEEIELSDSKLIETNMDGVTIIEGIFTNSKMIKTKLRNCPRIHATFAGSDISESEWHDSMFEFPNFKDAIAIKTKFVRVKNLNGAIFWNTNCTEADFSGTDLDEINQIDRVGMILNGATIDEKNRHLLGEG